ncbi:MAG: hypothetical protein M3Q81_04790, partial [bacterium]|nr:hypothetical protein [bacterium]
MHTNLTNLISKMSIAASLIIIGLAVIAPQSIVQAWDQGVKTYKDCFTWKVNSYPDTWYSGDEVKWIPVDIKGLEEGNWAEGQTEKQYKVTVTWREQVRHCYEWSNCSEWTDTSTTYEESSEGTIYKPEYCTVQASPTPHPSDEPCPSDEPTPSPTIEPSPVPKPSDEPEYVWNNPYFSALASDNLNCESKEFDAVVDLKKDGQPQKDRVVYFDFNGEVKEATTNENGRAKASFKVDTGTVYIQSTDFPSQSMVITPPVCSIDDEETGIGGGEVLGATT